MITKDYYNEEETRAINQLSKVARDEYIKQQLAKDPTKSEVDFYGTEPYHTLNKLYNKSKSRIELYDIDKKVKEMRL